jgi:predicted metalloprotease with PDZ domain
MKSLKVLGLLLLLSTSAWSQPKVGYQYTLDLTKVVDDKLYVELTPPPIKQAEVIFNFPAMIPGTYAIEDYGRFVSNFTVVDKNGKSLPVDKINDNSWKIKNANKAVKISYWVEDSFDTKLKGPEIFQPAGTNIEENKNFIINSSGYFGYIDGLREKPFTLNIIRAEDFYGATGLIALKTGEPLTILSKEILSDVKTKRVDVFQTENYDRLVDSPIMYAKPDTAVITVGNAEVLISSYSPNKKITAKEIAANVQEVLLAQKEYLGGNLPVSKYAFIFYFTDQPVYSYGALEHSYSSVYYMPEASIGDMQQQLRDFAAHEFFHIVTPLTIHSEEIGMFGFNNPKMSRHLWLYEGLTEYFAGNVQVKYGLISPEEYLRVLQGKMLGADQFTDNLAFTELSLGALDKHANQYGNVYEKGALISMCLDIKLRDLSNGKYGMQNLVAELGKKYGVSKSFKDEELFAEIVKMTYPEIGEFFTRHVSGTDPLPLTEIFAMVGVEYVKELVSAEYSLGLEQQAIAITQYEGKPTLAIGNVDALNEQGKALGFVKDDVLLKINGDKIPDLGPELGAFIQKQQQAIGEGKILRYTVSRNNTLVELAAPCQKAERKGKHIIRFAENPTPKQLALRTAWLKP